jgi:hypothetical protein
VSPWLGRPGSAALAVAFALTSLAGCGDNDTTTLTVEQTEGSSLEPEAPVGESRAFGVLSRPDSLDAVCRLIGISSVTGTGDRTACTQVVDDCRDNVSSALGTEGGDVPAPGLPPGDLQALLGCPLTLAQLDACIGAALERGIDEYGSSIGCDMPALPAVDPIRLLASPDCLVVLLQCPQLIASLAPPG